jgi:cytochrome c oxidase cbb3-type subunit 3
VSKAPRASSRPSLRSALLGASVLALAGCGHSEGGGTTASPAKASPTLEAIAAVPLGDLAGAAESKLGAAIPNPYGNSPQASQQGHELFVRMNCAGCHGYGATGGMGPNLTDTYWRYGGSPVAIFKSIYEGRPQGMPAWNPALPPQEIWKLVAYIQSLGGSYSAAQYKASVQGDRVGENVAPEVKPTLTGAAAASGPLGTSKSSATPDAEARPDAGGPPPGSKP